MHFRMELHSVNTPGAIFDRGHCIRGSRNLFEASRQFECLVTMRHPYRKVGRETAEQGRIAASIQVNVGMAVLAPGCRLYFAAQLVRDQLQAITDAENRHTE